MKIIPFALLFLGAALCAQEEPQPPAEQPPAEQPTTEAAQETAASGDPAAENPTEVTFEQAASKINEKLEASLDELSALRDQIAEETLPLSRELADLEGQLTEVRGEYQEKTRLLNTRALDLTNAQRRIKQREDEADYLSTLLDDYSGKFESRLHIAEMQRYEDALETAKLAVENTNLSALEVFQARIALLEVSLARAEEALGGATFEGTALGNNRVVQKGSFVIVGPAAIFLAEDGAVGTAEQQLGSLEAVEIDFANPEDALAATGVVSTGAGLFPLDPTLGNAHKVEAIEETLLEHIQKGGPVMIPIFTLAGLALLVALFKWLGMLFIRKPSKKKVAALLDAVAQRDEEGAQRAVRKIRGPVGKMLLAGVEHLREPRELIEEVMYERVLTTRLELNRMLPFIAICAASAPLLGLLGTVTGIISTFELITLFGSGDVKTLSGGISEALITTKFGLIVAIPSLLIHAFLSRKARGIVGKMETEAVAFLNQVTKTPLVGTKTVAAAKPPTGGTAAVDPDQVKEQVTEIVADLLGPLVKREDSGLAGQQS